MKFSKNLFISEKKFKMFFLKAIFYCFTINFANAKMNYFTVKENTALGNDVSQFQFNTFNVKDSESCALQCNGNDLCYFAVVSTKTTCILYGLINNATFYNVNDSKIYIKM